LNDEEEGKFRSNFLPQGSNTPIEGNIFRTTGWFPEKRELNLILNFNASEEAQVKYTLGKKDKSPLFLSRYWAQNRIKELLGEENLSQKQEKEIVKISKKFGIITPHTSLLVLQTLDQYITYQVEPPQQFPEMRNDYFLVINERKKQLQDHKDNKIFNVCSMWGRRLDWWRGNRDNKGMEHHFKDYSKEKSQQPTLWENPGEEYLFQSFEENKPKPICTKSRT